ncbi:MAG: hypothetical protein PHN64_06810 [Desulfovibrionaceae bacterium]|nr:hypothetical protein [Desulfovibrionaceae bacterium]
MGFGGGGSSTAPVVTPAPKAEVTKPVTAAATAARNQQKNKAAKAAGIQGSILAKPLSDAGQLLGKTLLGA